MNRVTRWRHKKGISKVHAPKELPKSYEGLARSIGKRYFPDLIQKFPEDFNQEISLLAVEAEKLSAIHVYVNGKRKKFAGGKNGLGVRAFTRAVQCRLHQVAKRYGLVKSSNSKYSKKEGELRDEDSRE